MNTLTITAHMWFSIILHVMRGDASGELEYETFSPNLGDKLKKVSERLYDCKNNYVVTFPIRFRIWLKTWITRTWFFYKSLRELDDLTYWKVLVNHGTEFFEKSGIILYDMI